MSTIENSLSNYVLCLATSNKRVSNYDFSNFDAKYEGLRKYDILALDKSFVVTLWMISIPVETRLV